MPFLLINSRTLHFLRCLVSKENTFCWTPSLNPEYVSTIKSQRQIPVFTGSFTQCTSAFVGLPGFLKKWISIHATSSQSSVCLSSTEMHNSAVSLPQLQMLTRKIFFFNLFIFPCESRSTEGAIIHLLLHSGLW